MSSTVAITLVASGGSTRLMQMYIIVMLLRYQDIKRSDPCFIPGHGSTDCGLPRFDTVQPLRVPWCTCLAAMRKYESSESVRRTVSDNRSTLRCSCEGSRRGNDFEVEDLERQQLLALPRSDHDESTTSMTRTATRSNFTSPAENIDRKSFACCGTSDCKSPSNNQPVRKYQSNFHPARTKSTAYTPRREHD